MRTSMVCAVMVTLVAAAGCGGSDADGGAGPPEILQVLVRERVDGELQGRLAFGDHEDIDAEVDDRAVSAAVARDGQRIRVVVDELLRGDTLEEVACADGSWSRVPAGTTVDDVAACTGADLSRCRGICIGADGAPVGILDGNGDGAIDDTRFIDGAATLVCDGAPVPLDPQRSYYQPSGGQRISAGSVGTDSLGPAVVLTPAAGIPPGARCGIVFADTVVDKDGERPCAAGAGGCLPGDTAAIDFTVEAFMLAWSEPHADAEDVPLTDEGSSDATIVLRLNATVDAATITGAVALTDDDEPVEGVTIAMSDEDDATVVLTVAGGFHGDSAYHLTITGLRDAYANTMDTSFTWHTVDEDKE